MGCQNWEVGPSNTHGLSYNRERTLSRPLEVLICGEGPTRRGAKAVVWPDEAREMGHGHDE